ncbi:DNA polymerase III subunit gamma/tau [Candidatus Uhrbacteria bacterium]|nr:DNA polymerase III subunit gamma/tau [Candidatus Uhrbacteria bacterium]
MSETLYRKYRPQTFSALIGQPHISTTLLHQLACGTVGHAYLFTGPRGVGKTTTARLLAKAVNCAKRSKQGEPCNACDSCTQITEGRSLDVVEMDAASHTGVDHVREHIIEAIRFTPHAAPYKVFIIDEVHMLSTSAFNALLKTLEEPPTHALFILATTEVHKLPETIISRTQRFDFHRIPLAELALRLEELCKKEKVKVDRAVIEEIARLSEGSQRDAESLLAQVLAVGDGVIHMEEAALVLPRRYLEEALALLSFIVNAQTKEAMGHLHRFVESGGDPSRLAEEIVSYARHLMLACLGDESALALAWPQHLLPTVRALAHTCSPVQWTEMINLFSSAVSEESSIPSLPLEIAVVKAATPFTPASGERSTSVEEGSAPPPQVEEGLPVQTPGKKDESPVVEFSKIQQGWNDIFAKVTEAHASLGFLLKSAEPLAMEGDTLTMGFHFKFHADTVNAPRNREKLESVLARIFSVPIRVRGEYVHGKADEIVGDLLEEFGGTEIS